MTGVRRIAGWVRRRIMWTLHPPPQASAFDARRYLAVNPDVAQEVLPGDALLHYLLHGWREGRWPNDWFDPDAYSSAYPDVRAAGVEPLLHYLTTGREEGRRAGVGGAEAVERALPVTDEAILRRQAALVKAHFDEQFYSTHYHSELEDGIDPLRHYLEQGWQQGWDPSPDFSTAHYLEDNPDVADARVNPLVHYIEHGLAEGRRLRQPPDPRLAQLHNAVSPRARAAAWRRGAAPAATMTLAELRAGLDELRGARVLLLSVSHDDYEENTGGVQQLVAREQRALGNVGVRYLHVAPARPMLMLADVDDPLGQHVHIRLDERRIGVVETQDLASVLGEVADAGVVVDAVVHQLLGHSPEAISGLLQAGRVAHPLVWVHDYSSMCSSYALLRNELEFCGAPPTSSTACTICCHGVERAGHLARMNSFFDAHEPVVLAPSAFAAETWRRANLPHHSLIVEAPARLVDVPPDEPAAERQTGRPLRVAHLGARTYLKGWHVFAQLAARFATDGRFEFLQLGLPGDHPLPRSIRNEKVQVSGTDHGAMTEALAAHKIDVVVNWSLAAETFSFTTFEALAAGAFIVVRRGSGNVWPAVQAASPLSGIVVDDVESLIDLFESGCLMDSATRAPGRRRLLVYRNPTVHHVLLRRLRLIDGLSPTGDD